MGEFKRGLSDGFITALAEFAQKPGWWQDVLADSSLIIGIRDEQFDVYWNGQSIFHVDFRGQTVNVNTHLKYLLDPDRSERIVMKENGTFFVESSPILPSYASGTLGKLKRAACLFSGMEKQCVHDIVRANENVVDVEIGFDARDLDTERNQPRIDIAAFEKRPNGAHLVFWEAKLFANKELRASGSSEPKVVRQIKEYEQVLQARKEKVLSSYRRVAENLVAIANMNPEFRKVGPVIREVANGEQLHMSSPSNVGLVIFGFDADQKTKGGVGHKHFEKLKEQLRGHPICTKGAAEGLKLCFQR